MILKEPGPREERLFICFRFKNLEIKDERGYGSDGGFILMEVVKLVPVVVEKEKKYQKSI